MEVYVDDMLVKSVQPLNHTEDLQEAFKTLNQYGMKLNPAKCAFGVSSRKFLGYMVSNRGIEANPEKIQAVLDVQSPKNMKQLQQLTGRIVALNRFISRSIDKCLPFFKILRKAFMWSDECEEAFNQLKKYLTSSPLLSRTVPREALYLYLAVSPIEGNATLIREERGVQKLVYFISKALRGAKEIFTDGKAGLDPCHCIKEASAIFPGSHHSGPYRISFEKSFAKAQSVWKVSQLGCQAGRI
jgi:hypothetical protein